VTLEEIEAMNPSHIVISPGPGTPEESGISRDVIRAFQGRIPILGVCLGHQALGQVFGGRVVRADKPCHGKVSAIRHEGEGILEGLPVPFMATRYPSLPEELKVTARTDDGTVMAMEHRDLPLFGVQFHPESILTEAGMSLLRNFHGARSSDSREELSRAC
jgi:anthranilate synthase/aminodeoxychorismate synthase-like glutamine amidotransferase